MAIHDILSEERFSFVANDDKAFILAFCDDMAKLGYDFGDKIGDGFCWGRYMLIFTKSGVKSRNVFARIYIRDGGIILRLFFSNIDKHRDYIEAAPAHIKEVFAGDFGNCQHCRNDKGGVCRFRKSYTLDGRFIEKCNGNTFWFPSPEIEKMSDYLALFSEFYPAKRLKTPAHTREQRHRLDGADT